MLNQPDWEGQLQRAHPEHPAPARLQRVLLQGPREVRLRRLRERALFMVLLTWKNKYFATIVLSVKIYDVGIFWTYNSFFGSNSILDLLRPTFYFE